MDHTSINNRPTGYARLGTWPRNPRERWGGAGGETNPRLTEVLACCNILTQLLELHSLGVVRVVTNPGFCRERNLAPNSISLEGNF